jgi:hypothetical protein
VTESQIQIGCVRWFKYQYPQFSTLLVHVPNGRRRHIRDAAKLKMEGVVAGVADLVLFVPSHGWHGLLIEIKTDKGRQSQSQKEWATNVISMGYRYQIAKSIDDFVLIIKEYLC